MEALFRSKHKNYFGHTQNHTFLTRQSSLLRRHPAARTCIFSRDATLVDTSQRKSSECQHRYIFPSAILILQISVHMASFRNISVQMLIKPFSSPDTPSRSHSNLLPYGFILTLFRPDLDQAIFEPRDTFPKQLQICFHMASFGHLSVQM